MSARIAQLPAHCRTAPIARARVARRATIARASGSAIAGKGLGDLDVVRLNAEDGSSAEVYLFGGVVTSFKPKGGDDVLYVRPDAKFDKSKPISGGLPHCA